MVRARNDMIQIRVWQGSDAGRTRQWVTGPGKFQGKCKPGHIKVMIKWKMAGQRGDGKRAMDHGWSKVRTMARPDRHDH